MASIFNKITNTKAYMILLKVLICALFILMTGQHQALALSIEDEAELGEKFFDEMRRQYDFMEDEFAKQYIVDLGNYLIASIEKRPFPFNFYILKDNNLNAFAGPGGHIFLYAGLIYTMAEIDEIAAVLCHEIGHVTARHLSERVEQNKKIGLATMAGMLAGALIGGEAASAIATGSMAAGIQTQLSYSRDDERHADKLGHEYMNMAGFDSNGMISALTKLQQGNWIGNDNIPPYLLTHPGGPERMSNIESLINSHPSNTKREETEYFRKLFPLFKTVVRANSLDPTEAERVFRLELEKDPESALAHFGFAIALREKADYAQAVTHFQEALKGFQDKTPVLRCLAETYQFMGKNNTAIELLEGVLKENPYDKASLFLVASSYQNMEEYAKAEKVYERLTVMEPVKDEVFYNLGIVYGRQDKLGLAHYNFGLYYNELKQPKEAEFHFKKAEEFSEKDPELTKKIRKELAKAQEKKR
jgi:predicted Zn-dependent protease